MELRKRNPVTDVELPPLDTNAPTKTYTATFSMGCFWAPDALFGSMHGVVRTRAGYAGGHKDQPNYHDLGDHAETVQIEYDPTQVSYRDLLEQFWANHDPSIQPPNSQYRSIIFYHDDQQRRLAQETKVRQEKSRGTLYTAILPYDKFYLAESYHQKYRLRHDHDLMKEFAAMYPDSRDFMNSTAAARINGYLEGYGQFSTMQRELNRYGLSGPSIRRLIHKIK